MRLSGIAHLSGLYEAARHSAAPVRKRLSPREAEAAELATAADDCGGAGQAHDTLIEVTTRGLVDLTGRLRQ